MRIRTIKPEFWSSETMGSVSLNARLLAIGLINMSDDEGYFQAHPRFISAQLFPYDEKPPSIKDCLNELESKKFVEIYVLSSGKHIGHVLNFKEHQVINKKKSSKLKSFIEAEEGKATVRVPEEYGMSTVRAWVGSGSGSGSGKGIGRGVLGDKKEIEETRPTIKKSQGTDSPKPKAKAKKKPNPDIATFIKEFTLIFQAVNHNEKPSWGAKGAGQVKTLLSQQSLPVLIKRLGNFRAHHKAGSFGADSFDLGSFVTHLDKWAVPPKAKNARFVDPQELEMLGGCRDD